MKVYRTHQNSAEQFPQTAEMEFYYAYGLDPLLLSCHNCKMEVLDEFGWFLVALFLSLIAGELFFFQALAPGTSKRLCDMVTRIFGRKPAPSMTDPESLVGAVAEVRSGFLAEMRSGMVFLHGEFWNAELIGEAVELEVGSRVVVRSIVGLRVHVEPVEYD